MIVPTHPGLRQYPQFIPILFWFAGMGVKPKWTGPTTKKSVVGLLVQIFSFELAFLTLGFNTSSWEGSSGAKLPPTG